MADQADLDLAGWYRVATGSPPEYLGAEPPPVNESAVTITFDTAVVAAGGP